MRTVHDGVGREARLVLAVPATEDVRPDPDAVGLAGVAAYRASEAVRETTGKEVGKACRVVREGPLEVGDGTWAAHLRRLPRARLMGQPDRHG